MKGNIKKLALVVFMTAIPMLIAVATASAASTSIKGHYALSGFTSCSVMGGPAAPGILEAVYIFNNDGTGSATGWVRQITDPSVTPNVLYMTLDFTYTVTEGRIEFAYLWGGFKVYLEDKTTFLLQWDAAMSHGVISPDGKIMTITCGPPNKLHPIGAPPEVEGVCVTSLAGMRVHDKKWEWD